jgi:hypothetical protein
MALTDVNANFTDPTVKRQYSTFLLGETPLFKEYILESSNMSLILTK